MNITTHATKKEKGFGFIGLLIVIAIIGLSTTFFASTYIKSDDSETPGMAIQLAEEAKQQAEESAEKSSSGVQTSNVINLSGQGLTKAPESIFSKTNTDELNLSNNNIDGSLQAEVRHLGKLKVLNLSNNNFTGVPAEVGQLSHLEILNLSGNPLTGLPNELANLKNLQVLDLRNTQYSTQDLEVIKNGLSGGVVIYTD